MQSAQPGTATYRQGGGKTTLDVSAFAAGALSGGGDAGAAGTAGDSKEVKPAASAAPTSTKLGWFEGVMVPVLLNIWGVIMFLRLGWVAGQAGLGGGTLIIVLSNVVTTITALSLCAIATNGEVKGGGAYYLISRALGPQFGGALGVLFYVAQSVAVSLYVIGFAESVVGIYVADDGSGTFTGDPINDLRVIGICTTVFLLIVALIGVGWYAKVQVLLLAILIISMTAVVIGAFLPGVPSEATNEAAGFVGLGNVDVSQNLDADYTIDLDTLETHTFFSVFAIFFPAVTGIMAGANLSGDLAEPSVAIPKGTLWGILVTFITYIALLWIVGSAAERCAGAACAGVTTLVNGVNVTYAYNTQDWVTAVNDEVGGVLPPSGGMVYNRLIMKDISVWEPLVFAGVFAATLSSALASLVGAPRILQALAKDKLYNFWLLNWFAQLDEEEAPAQEDSAAPTALPPAGTAGSTTAPGAPGAHALLVDKSAAAGTSGAVAQAEDMDNVATVEEDTGDSAEPKRGYFLTFLVACGCVLVGRLDAIAPLISNFFMISYALTNYAVFAASMSETPGWRPSFVYYNKYVSAVGAVLCIIVMFAFDWVNALVSVVICIVLYKYLEYTDPPKHWGPAGDAARYLTAVRALYKLRRVRTDADGRSHVKTYRPSYLVLTDDPRSDEGKNLTMFVAKLYKGRGISVIGQVLLEDAVPVDEEQFVAFAGAQRRRNQKMLDRAIIVKKGEGVVSTAGEAGGDEEAGTVTRRASSGQYGVHGQQFVGATGLAALALSDSQRQGLMAEVLVAPTLRRGCQLLLQLGGVGTLRANTLVHSYPEGWFMRPTDTQTDRTALDTGDILSVLRSRISDFERLTGDALGAGMGAVVLRDPGCKMNDGVVPIRRTTGAAGAGRVAADGTVTLLPPPAVDAEPTVDAWWLSDEGGLAVLLPHLLTQNPQFAGHKMRVFTTGSPNTQDSDATVAAQDRSLKLAGLMSKLRFKGDAMSMKMDYSALRADTVASFNAIFPGLLPADFTGVDGAAAGGLASGLRPEAVAAMAAAEDAAAPAADAKEAPPAPAGDMSWAACPSDLDKDVRRLLVAETKHILRASEMIREASAGADVTFIVMPRPASHYPSGLLATYMEVLSASLGTVVLVRGSGAPVVTLSS